MATRSLARLAGDYITFVQLIRDAPPQAIPAADALRNQLLGLLEPVQKGGAAEGISPDEIDEARFALVAFADEMVQRSGWPGREEWTSEPLQSRLYRTTRAGNEFYDHLANLRPEQNAAREIYLLAMTLGFEGQYAGQEAERRALMAHQYETLRASGYALEVAREQNVLPSAYNLEIELPSGRGTGVGAWLGLMIVGLALLYGIGWALLYFLAGDVPLPRGG